MKNCKLLTFLAAVILVTAAAGPVMGDLIGFWNFDAGNAQTGAGGVKDLATENGSHDGTLVGGSFSTDVPAVLGGGRSLDLTGGDYYVVIDSFLNGAADNDFNTGEALSVSVWVKGWPDGNWEPFVSKRGESGQGWQIRRRSNANDPTFTLRGTSGGDDPSSSQAVGPNEGWTHLAGTYDGSVRKLYVNGVETMSIEDTGAIATTAHYVVFGARDNGGSGSNIGSFSRVMLDDIGIWNNALTAEEVQDLANGISPIQYPGAQIIYPEYGDVVDLYPATVTAEWVNMDPCSAEPVYVDVWFGTDTNKVTGSVDGSYTKIISAENISSCILTPPGPGIYYWQVDTYNHGKPLSAGGSVDYSTGDPCMVEGRVYMFTNDSPIASVNAGPDMVTWVGEPVALIADVNDDGGSPLTYLWTTGELAPGVSAVFNPSADVADTAITISLAPYNAAGIFNAGFEATVLADAGWGSATGWNSIGGWSGAWNPAADGTEASYGGVVPEGDNVAWVGLNHTDGAGMAQVLSETFTENTAYELKVEVGKNEVYDWPGYKVQLAAGGTVIAEDDNTLDPVQGTFATSIVNYTYDAVADANKIGEPLEIRLVAKAAPGANWAEMNFDNVRLTASIPFPAPETGSVDVTLTVNDATNPAVSDTMTIHVYPDACTAARTGMGVILDSDFNDNCQVYPEDLATMAATWLSTDKELTQAVTDPGNNWPGNIFSVNFYAHNGLSSDEFEHVELEPKQYAGYGDWLISDWTNILVPWNPGGPLAPVTITSSEGSAATFTFMDTRNGGGGMTAGGIRTVAEGDGNGDLFDGAAMGTWETDDSQINHVVVSDIPFASYDVILYLSMHNWAYGDGTGIIEVNGQQTDFTAQHFDGTFTEIANTGDVGNYIVYKGLAGPSLAIKVWGNGFNHIGFSGFQVRETDPNAPVVSAGDSWITWLGEPVTVDGTIDGTNTLWNMEDTVFSWTVDAMGGLDVVVSDLTIEDPTVTITRIDPYWWEVPIHDSSFETKVMSPDGQMKWFMTRPDETSWRFADPDNSAYNVDDGKGAFGQLFLWNPKAGTETANWNRAGMDGIVPDGDNCVIVGSILRGFEGSTDHPGGLAKLLVPDIANADNNDYPTYNPAASYELSAYIGRNGVSFSNSYGYRVELLAGGENVRSSDQYTDKVVGGTVIGSVEGTTDVIDPNTFIQVTVPVDPAPAANADLAGEPLQIRITSLKKPEDPNTQYIIVDDVKLSTDDPPALEPVTMTLTVTEQATGNTVASSTFIDVYENPCDAAVGSDPTMEFDLGDLTEDCITNMEDFALFAADWLIDYTLTGAEAKP